MASTDNKEKKIIYYSDAWLKIYDNPVFYFPKFFHPDPSVKRQSGFLTPALGSSSNLGSSFYAPYFYVISESEDITIKPTLFNNNKFLIQNEFRKKTKNSITLRIILIPSKILIFFILRMDSKKDYLLFCF